MRELMLGEGLRVSVAGGRSSRTRSPHLEVELRVKCGLDRRVGGGDTLVLAKFGADTDENKSNIGNKLKR